MRFNGQPALGLAVSMRQGGDVIHLGQQLDETIKRIQASLPVGVQLHAVSDQPRVVEHSVHEFKKSLGRSSTDRAGGELLLAGRAHWPGGGAVHPAGAGHDLPGDVHHGIDLQRISLGALIIALGLLVDDAIIAVEMMGAQAGAGLGQVPRCNLCLYRHCLPHADRDPDQAAGFLPVGFARSGTGEYVYSLFQVVGVSLILSWVVAVLFTPYIGFKLLKEEKHAHHDEDAV